MTSINYISTSRIATSTIQSFELKLYDSFSNVYSPLLLSNNTLLVNDQPVRGGGGSFASSLSTYQVFTSTLLISPPESFTYTALFNLDVTGTARVTNYISTGSIYTGAQYVGLQFGQNNTSLFLIQRKEWRVPFRYVRIQPSQQSIPHRLVRRFYYLKHQVMQDVFFKLKISVALRDTIAL